MLCSQNNGFCVAGYTNAALLTTLLTGIVMDNYFKLIACKNPSDTKCVTTWLVIPSGLIKNEANWCASCNK